MPVGILVVAEIRLYREGLAEALALRPALRVLGAVASPAEAVALLERCHPDVILVDMAMQQGVTAARTLLNEVPDARIVALAVADQEPDLITCAELGVAGLVSRDASLDDLVAALESAARDEVLCTARMAAVLMRRLAKLAAERGQYGREVALTLREREVIDLIDRGLSNKEIARRLGIEVATAKNHVHNILEKLQVHRRWEAAARVRSRLRRVAPGAEI